LVFTVERQFVRVLEEPFLGGKRFEGFGGLKRFAR
jgi:hypothetical protein